MWHWRKIFICFRLIRKREVREDKIFVRIKSTEKLDNIDQLSLKLLNKNYKKIYFSWNYS